MMGNNIKEQIIEFLLCILAVLIGIAILIGVIYFVIKKTWF